MNPRYRRLLIPGLLIVLIVIVLISSLARDARGTARAQPAVAAGQVVSTISDPAITESSGLVLGIKHPDLAYTINDSGNDPIVFAIEVSTGDVVGQTRLAEPWTDAEALSIDNTGTLWIADVGDNAGTRDAVTLFALPEPGPGDRRATSERHQLTFPDGARDVEALVVNPRTDAKFLVSKDLGGGEVYAIPDQLGADNQLKVVAGAEVAPLLTDGAFTADGKHILLRDYGTVRSYDAATWKQVSIAKLPEQKQGETLAAEPRGDSILIGSEGADSQLVRVAFNPSPEASDPASGAGDAAAEDNDSTLMGTTWLILAFVLVAGAGILVVRRRR